MSTNTSRDDDERDSERFRPTHDGSRGPAFRDFKSDFLTFSRTKFAKDDRYSFYTAYKRMDEGGTGQGAPALPAQQGGAGGGNNPAYNAAIVKRNIRQGQAFGFLYESQTDRTIRQMLSDLAENNPAELAADAWDLIVQECDEPDDDLELAKLNTLWTTATIMNTVGHSVSTITDFSRYLNNLNAPDDGIADAANVLYEHAAAIRSIFELFFLLVDDRGDASLGGGV